MYNKSCVMCVNIVVSITFTRNVVEEIGYCSVVNLFSVVKVLFLVSAQFFILYDNIFL